MDKVLKTHRHKMQFKCYSFEIMKGYQFETHRQIFGMRVERERLSLRRKTKKCTKNI
jgi:hypothetical protein